MLAQNTSAQITGRFQLAPFPVCELLEEDLGLVKDAWVAVCKPWFWEQHRAIHEHFMLHKQPEVAIRHHSDVVDMLIQGVAHYSMRHSEHFQHEVPALMWVALGGYGRRRLFPYSDVDILCVHEEPWDAQAKAWVEQYASFLFYMLWDCGLQVGHAVRTVAGCQQAATEDHTVLTALLDARVLVRDEKLWDGLHGAARAAHEHWGDAAFIEAKLKERERRHAKGGDSRYILEPNVKEGKGALRDMHTLYWLARFAFDIERVRDLVPQGRLTESEYRKYRKAQHFLWMVRMYLHYFAARPEERLTFDMQRRIAEVMGYRGATSNQMVERFMKRYFQVVRDVGILTGLFCATLEEEHRRAPKMSLATLLDRWLKHEEIILQAGRLNFATPEVVVAKPWLMMRLFYEACTQDLPIHPRALQAISRSLRVAGEAFRHHEGAVRCFLAILQHPQRGYATLRMMNDTGLLARFIPDFAHVVGQMQFDMYHIYTVDEHTLHAIGILHAVERGEYKEELPQSTHLMPMITARRVLYLAMFCHDIAKGRGGDHEAKGVPIGKKIAKQLGFDQGEIDTVGWLIQHQSLMSDAVFKRDLHDPATIHYFSKEVQTVERLRLLFVLTVADIRAVGPKVWNGWKGNQLRHLYRLCAHYLRTGSLDTHAGQLEELRRELQELLPHWGTDEIEAYLWSGHSQFFSSRDAMGHALVAMLLQDARIHHKAVVMDVASESQMDATRCTICVQDRKGLMADIAAAITLTGLNIVHAAIFTLKDGWAVQTWIIQGQDGHAVELEHHGMLQQNVEEVLSGQIDAPRLLAKMRTHHPSKKEQFEVPTLVSFENEDSVSSSIIEISTADRVGLLHAICRCLQAQALNISSAHINTYGEKAVDVFYVRDSYGMKIMHPKRMQQIKEALEDAVGMPRPQHSGRWGEG